MRIGGVGWSNRFLPKEMFHNVTPVALARLVPNFMVGLL